MKKTEFRETKQPGQGTQLTSRDLLGETTKPDIPGVSGAACRGAPSLLARPLAPAGRRVVETPGARLAGVSQADFGGRAFAALSGRRAVTEVGGGRPNLGRAGPQAWLGQTDWDPSPSLSRSSALTWPHLPVVQNIPANSGWWPPGRRLSTAGMVTLFHVEQSLCLGSSSSEALTPRTTPSSLS